MTLLVRRLPELPEHLLRLCLRSTNPLHDCTVTLLEAHHNSGVCNAQVSISLIDKTVHYSSQNHTTRWVINPEIKAGYTGYIVIQ